LSILSPHSLRLTASICIISISLSPAVFAQDTPNSAASTGTASETGTSIPGSLSGDNVSNSGSRRGAERGGPPKVIFDDNWVTIGAGVGYRPSYEGSDDYKISPSPLIQGSVKGFDFGARGPGLYVDVIRDSGRKQGREKKVQFVVGPQILLRLDRTGNVKDPVVSLLGDRKTAVEIGFTAGVAIKKVVNPFDTLTLSIDAQWDVAGAHNGSIMSPSISYSTPVSRAAFVNLSLSADRVDDNYARTYYSIDAAGSTASGLPLYNAKAGWKKSTAFLVAAYDLSGNALDGGFSVFALTSYSQLLGDAKRTPSTSIRGSDSQYFIGGGVAYSF
jgi:MipA family protein